ncbi:hypothetical protein [Pelomonas sp. Root1237]|uniref:hypothetical protein n=1 Tax=Pelomonas sp. Root1237 TaxID=1736434 RepID=UPI0006F2D8A0|nr:hypothetical protein [Pelomonas sp. Root1237]KQV88141.1 hypothetical protein ASC91_15045 [Pelomonas sp. Root1237]
MTDAPGLQWPLDAKGKRATGAPGQRIIAAALRGLDATAADAVAAEHDWRHAYPAHWCALVQAQAARPVGVVASARAGLAAAWRELPFMRAGQAHALADAMNTPQRRLQTLQLRGSGDAAPARWTVPHQGRELHGDALARQIDRWEKGGICEAAHAGALRDCLAHPEWFDLSDQHLVLLGAGSEAGPLAWLAKWRANLVGIDLARAATWKRIAAIVAAGNATLIAPVAPDQPLDVAHAGADLLADTPEIAAWLASRQQPLSIANLAYLDGERHVRVSLAMDAISATLCAADARTQLAYMATPTDVFAVPEQLARDVMRRYAERGLVKKLGQFGARLGSGGRGFAPHIEGLIDAGDFGRDSGTWGLVDALVVEQGPNYALAKRLQQWRALVARADGHRVAFNVAPSTTTASVVSNPLLAAGFRGAKAFGVEVFAPATTNALMAAMWVHQLRTEARDFAHPLKLLVHTANHGGLWRLPYRPRSVLPMAALLGFVKRR